MVMTFAQDAQIFLEQSLWPRLKNFLSESEYVQRLLFREKADITTARALHRFRKDQGTDTEDEVLEDREFERQPYVLLLGNAGSGKSFVLAFACTQAIQRFLSNPASPFPLFLDLDKDLPTTLSVQSIEDTLNFHHNGLFKHACTEASGRYALFLDGLDEVLRRSRPFINDLQMFLQKHWTHLAQVIVACRRPAWSPDWFATTPVQLSVYHADDLGWQEYAQILPETAMQQEFFQQCHALGIAALLDTPFDGFYLAREFRASRPLPSSRRACLDQRITEALRGRQIDRQDGDAPSVDDLRFLARQLACVGSFTYHTAWTLQEATDLLGASQVLRLGRPVRPEEVRTLFIRPLFKKSNEQFAFVHQLYQEFLAAEALAALPLRKQRQLLATKRPGQHRMQTTHRGIAVFLAEASEAFADYLIDADPLVAFLAEMPSLSHEVAERLLKTVLDDAVASSRAPWWEIPPRGERPREALRKHRPRDVAAFLQPYLTSTDEIARIWGTACAEAWDGAKALNRVLQQLAHDPSQNVGIRKSAVAAIAATKELKAVRGLYDLFDDSRDEVRGEVLRAYRQVDGPAPRDFIAKLRGGSRDTHLYCLLQIEAEGFGCTLEVSQLREAFEAVTEHFADLRDLKLPVLRGLFRQAIALRFADVPVDLFVQCWDRLSLSHDQLLSDEETIIQFLRQEPVLFERVWSHVLARLESSDERIYSIVSIERLAACCTDRIFDFLPPRAEGLSRDQQWFIEHVLARYFYQEPTAERLAYFQRLAPAFTQSLRLPPPPKQPIPRDALADKQKLLNALTEGGQDPIQQTWNVLCTIREIKYGVRSQSQVSEEDVLDVLDQSHPIVRKRVMQAFRACVAQLPYERRTYSAFEIPFWVLRQRREIFPPQKVAEIITCYYDSGTNNTRYEELLEEIRQQHRALWQQCILQLLEGGLVRVEVPLRYLITIKEDIYVGQCAERLVQGACNRPDLTIFLEYLSALRPAGYRDTLRHCYTRLKQQFPRKSRQATTNTAQDFTALSYWDQFQPLLILMSDDDEWAWHEFAHRLRRDDVPLHPEQFSGPFFRRFPMHVTRLPILADWYALIRRQRHDDNWGWSGLAQHLLETIVAIGGESAMQELQRLQKTDAFPDARWLSHAILRIEDRLLTEESVPWESGPVLDFINKERLGVILNERDLFEWVCRAIEEVQEGLEQRGEGVAGFWKGNTPHHETWCQNVLWPLLRLTLQRSDITAVEGEEKFIGANRCDFWVEYPRSGASSFRVGVELKVARKGYGPKELVHPVETQLWEKYLRPTGCRHGIFIVLWYRDNKRYHGPLHWENRDALAAVLRQTCVDLALQYRVSLASYVIDLMTPFRQR
jgi:hypothetical protein